MPPTPVSAGGAADRLTIPSAGATTAEQVNSLLMDDRRLQDVRKYEPGAITRSRELLRQSAEASNAQNYVRAGELAQQAQQTLVEAENRAAGKSARRDLGAAASRINLAQASSSVLFAPAQVTEAINLYEQAQSSLKYGDNLQARQAAEQAVTAADDARLFNVRKARDLASLSVRYGGWKAASDELISANTAAADAEKMLARTDTAPYGQQVAQQAVQCAQIALDRSRDFTFQERLDNIYKALNTAMRAGANYFNVDEVKRLIAELAVARDEYCTRNFDAVELKLKDIEARLARVIETTPLVLEQNLIHTTDKLNALVLAGAENWMAQEVDDVKTLMNNSAVQFRKHDYQGSYTAIRDALKLVDRIENRLQEQVYYDAVTELFAQLDRAFKDMGPILDYDRTFLKKVIDHPSGQNRALAFAGKSSPNDFRDKVTDIYLRAIHLKPPKKLEGTHNEVLLAVKSAKVSAENFQKLYIMDQVSRPDAYEILDTAFNQVNRSKKLRADIQIRMIEPEARVKVIRAEKIINY